jgi:hypothetical protein
VGQAIAHETLEARKGVRALSRTGKIARMIRIVARSIRVVTKSRLFRKFKAKHHLEHRKNNSKKKIVKKVSKKKITKKKTI